MEQGVIHQIKLKSQDRRTKAWTNYLLRGLCWSGPGCHTCCWSGPRLWCSLWREALGNPLKFLQKKLPGSTVSSAPAFLPLISSTHSSSLWVSEPFRWLPAEASDNPRGRKMEKTGQARQGARSEAPASRPGETPFLLNQSHISGRPQASGSSRGQQKRKTALYSMSPPNSTSPQVT